MDNIGKISFIGCRVNFLEFDTYEMDKDTDNKHVFPIKAEFNGNFNELVVCTRNDIRFIDINDGQTKKIYINLIDPEESDEITVFRLIHKNHKFIVGDHKGNVRIYNYNTGDLMRKLEAHKTEVVEIKIDNYNKLYISGG
jgi:WD40 repeat protein